MEITDYEKFENRVEYNKRILKNVSDKKLIDLEDEICGLKDEKEKIILELKTIIYCSQNSDVLNKKLIEEFLDEVSTMAKMDIDYINYLKKVIALLQIYLGIDFVFYQAVKYAEDSIKMQVLKYVKKS